MCQPYWLLRHTSNTVKKVEEGFEINYYLNCKKLVKKLNRTPEKIMVKSMAIRGILNNGVVKEKSPSLFIGMSRGLLDSCSLGFLHSMESGVDMDSYQESSLLQAQNTCKVQPTFG